MGSGSYNVTFLRRELRMSSSGEPRIIMELESFLKEGWPEIPLRLMVSLQQPWQQNGLKVLEKLVFKRVDS